MDFAIGPSEGDLAIQHEALSLLQNSHIEYLDGQSYFQINLLSPSILQAIKNLFQLRFEIFKSPSENSKSSDFENFSLFSEAKYLSDKRTLILNFLPEAIPFFSAYADPLYNLYFYKKYKCYLSDFQNEISQVKVSRSLWLDLNPFEKQLFLLFEDHIQLTEALVSLEGIYSLGFDEIKSSLNAKVQRSSRANFDVKKASRLLQRFLSKLYLNGYISPLDKKMSLFLDETFLDRPKLLFQCKEKIEEFAFHKALASQSSATLLQTSFASDLQKLFPDSAEIVKSFQVFFKEDLDFISRILQLSSEGSEGILYLDSALLLFDWLLRRSAKSFLKASKSICQSQSYRYVESLDITRLDLAKSAKKFHEILSKDETLLSRINREAYVFFFSKMTLQDKVAQKWLEKTWALERLNAEIQAGVQVVKEPTSAVTELPARKAGTVSKTLLRKLRLRDKDSYEKLYNEFFSSLEPSKQSLLARLKKQLADETFHKQIEQSFYNYLQTHSKTKLTSVSL